jgi:hypothetical protein
MLLLNLKLTVDAYARGAGSVHCPVSDGKLAESAPEISGNLPA